MSDNMTAEQLRQIVTDAAAGIPNVHIAQPGQFPAVEALFGSLFAGIDLTAAIAGAARDCVDAWPDLVPDKIAAMMLRHGDFVAAWNHLDDRARTELMCTWTAAATDRQVGPDAIAGDRLHHIYARDLLELAAKTTAKGMQLVPDPVNPANTPLWCYAVSTVCDSSDPELAKIRAVCLLAAAAIKAEPAAARTAT